MEGYLFLKKSMVVSGSKGGAHTSAASAAKWSRRHCSIVTDPARGIYLVARKRVEDNYASHRDSIKESVPFASSIVNLLSYTVSVHDCVGSDGMINGGVLALTDATNGSGAALETVELRDRSRESAQRWVMALRAAQASWKNPLQPQGQGKGKDEKVAMSTATTQHGRGDKENAVPQPQQVRPQPQEQQVQVQVQVQPNARALPPRMPLQTKVWVGSDATATRIASTSTAADAGFVAKKVVVFEGEALPQPTPTAPVAPAALRPETAAGRIAHTASAPTLTRATSPVPTKEVHGSVHVAALAHVPDLVQWKAEYAAAAARVKRRAEGPAAAPSVQVIHEAEEIETLKEEFHDAVSTPTEAQQWQSPIRQAMYFPAHTPPHERRKQKAAERAARKDRNQSRMVLWVALAWVAVVTTGLMAAFGAFDVAAPAMLYLPAPAPTTMQAAMFEAVMQYAGGPRHMQLQHDYTRVALLMPAPVGVRKAAKAAAPVFTLIEARLDWVQVNARGEVDRPRGPGGDFVLLPEPVETVIAAASTVVVSVPAPAIPAIPAAALSTKQISPRAAARTAPTSAYAGTASAAPAVCYSVSVPALAAIKHVDIDVDMSKGLVLLGSDTPTALSSAQHPHLHRPQQAVLGMGKEPHPLDDAAAALSPMVRVVGAPFRLLGWLVGCAVDRVNA